MKSSRSSRANDRGVTLVIVLFILVILALVAAGVLTNTRYSANNSLSVQTKNQTFDAAEAGVNLAEWTLDQASATTSGAG